MITLLSRWHCAIQVVLMCNIYADVIVFIRILQARTAIQMDEDAAADELLMHHLTAVATQSSQLFLRHKFAILDLCTY